MQQEIVINAIADEVRVALVENGLLTELYIEEKERKHITGNIYKGRVTRVLPGMQAAFVDIGLAKDAFLYVMDIHDNIEKYELEDEDGGEPGAAGNGGQSSAGEAETAKNGRRNKRKDRCLSIENKLKSGQEVIVQIAKEPMGTKGARVTSHISLPGRYLVYMPTVEHIGISRRIASAAERARLREIIKRHKPPGCGFIVRTAGGGKDEELFKHDIEFLTKLWAQILKNAEKVSPPALLHSDLDIIFKSFRDIFSNDVDRVMIDSEEQFNRCVEFADSLMPQLSERIKLYMKPKPIFDYCNIESQIEQALKRKVWLKSGGYIIIDETEALVAIDVNTGKYVGKKNLEETIFKINLEAIQVITRQVRLRGLGGIIIIDFIDMKEEKHRKQVLQVLEEALKKDRARTNILQLTELGLVEMTRKRARQSLGKILSQPCPCCKGSGRVKSALNIYNTIQRELLYLPRDDSREEIMLQVHPEVAKLICSANKQRLKRLQQICGKKVLLNADENLSHEDYNIMAI